LDNLVRSGTKQPNPILSVPGVRLVHLAFWDLS